MEERQRVVLDKLTLMTREINENKRAIQEIRSRIAYYVGGLVLIGFLLSVFGRYVVGHYL